jgi:hypothetical protein
MEKLDIVNDREEGGKQVRQIWTDHVRNTIIDPDPKHLLPWEQIDEYWKEIDRVLWEKLSEPYRQALQEKDTEIHQLRDILVYYFEHLPLHLQPKDAYPLLVAMSKSATNKVWTHLPDGTYLTLQMQAEYTLWAWTHHPDPENAYEPTFTVLNIGEYNPPQWDMICDAWGTPVQMPIWIPV